MNNPIIKVSTDKLVKAVWNYKTDGTEEIIEKLIKSATYQKSIGIIAVREIGKDKYEIIDGNHRLDAIRKLKIKEVRVENFGKISKAKAVLISKQRNTVWFEDDNLRLAKLFRDDLLKELSAKEISEMLPMDESTIANLGNLLDWDWSKIPDNDKKVSDDKYEIKINVDKSIYDKWIEWKEKCKNILGYDSNDKCFEFAIIEALNIPDDSLK